MSSSPAGSATPFSDYTSLRSSRGLTDTDNSRVLEVYILKNSTDPTPILIPTSRAETFSDFWEIIKNDLHPGTEETESAPMIYLLDPFMTRLRSDLWPDLLPTLRGKRLLVLPPSLIPPDPKPVSKKNTWSAYPTPKCTPTTPETTRLTVDAHTPRAKLSSPLTPQTSPQRILNRSESFRKTPEFAFDIAFWCRFAPSYKPSLLMHVQFREIILQVVPEQSRGLDVTLLLSKISSALTNMLRRQGCLGVLTSQPMANFRDLLVKPESLALALEDWPSSKEALGVTAETLRWMQEPVLLYCEIRDVHFPQMDERKRPVLRKVQVESASEDEVD